MNDLEFRQVTPISRHWGIDRGVPIDRYYIAKFLNTYSREIAGRVLEMQSDQYARFFGGPNVSAVDVLDVSEKNRRATLVADLTNAPHLPQGVFDCIICTQTLQYIYECRAAVATLHSLLKPGGSVLVTVPGITKVDGRQPDCPWYWRFTTESVERLFGETFRKDQVTVTRFGNVLSSVAFLHGVAAHELTKDELNSDDPEYDVIIGVRAVRATNV
jgi:SAM-dependent methyltransferase